MLDERDVAQQVVDLRDLADSSGIGQIKSGSHEYKVKSTNSPLKKLRLELKLSQSKLAEEIGVAVSTIRRWEKGQAEPTMTVAQMKKFCQISQKNFNNLPDSLLPPKLHKV